MNKNNQNNTTFRLVGLIFGAVIIGIGVTIFVYDKSNVNATLFLSITGVVCAMLPFTLHSIQKLNVGPVGIETREIEGAIVAATSALQDIDLYLEGRREMTNLEIMERLENLNQPHLDLIYQYIESWRTKQVFRIMKIKGSEKLRESTRKELRRLLPLFESLLIIANGQDYDKHLHFYYSRLAFVYKDMDRPDWEKAYENINYAIGAFDDSKLKRDADLVPDKFYEFNRLVCAINKEPLSPDEQKKLRGDFETFINDKDLKMLAKEKNHETIAPGLQEWLLYIDCWEKANGTDEEKPKTTWLFLKRDFWRWHFWKWDFWKWYFWKWDFWNSDSAQHPSGSTSIQPGNQENKS